MHFEFKLTSLQGSRFDRLEAELSMATRGGFWRWLQATRRFQLFTRPATVVPTSSIRNCSTCSNDVEQVYTSFPPVPRLFGAALGLQRPISSGRKKRLWKCRTIGRRCAFHSPLYASHVTRPSGSPSARLFLALPAR